MDEEDISFIEGKVKYDMGKYNEAITALLTSLNNNPDHLPTYYYLGKSYLLYGNYEAAKACFLELIVSTKELLDYDPKKIADYYDSIGMCYMQLGNTLEANKHYDLSLEKDPSNRSAQHNKALLYLTCAQQEATNIQMIQAYKIQSLSLLNEILQHEPHHVNALHTKGSWFEIDEDYANAIVHYKQAINYCSPTDKETLCGISTNLAECYAQLGHIEYHKDDYHLAQSYYQQSLNENNAHVYARNQLGMCCYKLKNYLTAQHHFTILLENAQTDQDKADALMNRAACLRERKKYSRALDDLNEIKALAPDDDTLPTEILKLQQAAATRLQHEYRGFWNKKNDVAPQILTATAQI